MKVRVMMLGAAVAGIIAAHPYGAQAAAADGKDGDCAVRVVYDNTGKSMHEFTPDPSVWGPGTCVESLLIVKRDGDQLTFLGPTRTAGYVASVEIIIQFVRDCNSSTAGGNCINPITWP